MFLKFNQTAVRSAAEKRKGVPVTSTPLLRSNVVLFRGFARRLDELQRLVDMCGLCDKDLAYRQRNV
jgi:hypothetical protein